VVSDSEITVIVPSAIHAAPISITNPYATTETDSDFVLTPHVTTFYPAQAPVGHPVQIEGRGFLHTSAVRFGSTSATFAVLSDSILRTWVPAGATDAPLTIANLAGTATTPTFHVGALTGVEEPRLAFGLSVAQPNPTAAGVRWSLSLVAPGWVRATILDAAGSRVRALISEQRAAGRHTIEWDGRSARGGRARPGVYFLVVETAAGTRRVPVILLR
jgi:hypothetical protein